jgi:SAM-dependent methyltransferase
VFQGAKQIRDAYRDDGVAHDYIEERFKQPLGRHLHERQAAALTALIQRERPRRVLELAPGPARLTRDVARRFDGTGFVVDTSMQMLGEARRRLKEFSGWHATQSDAFSLPFRCTFDLVYSFRLIRHFELPERAALYRQITSVLRPGGVLVFDAVNALVSQPLRERAKPGEYEHYDALLTREQLAQELADAGFRVESLIGLQHTFTALMRVQVLIAPRSQPLAQMLIAAIDRVGRGEPLEWIVVCRRA